MESDTSTENPTLANPPLDETCRILIVSSSLTVASSFIDRLKSLSSSSALPSSESIPTSRSTPTSSVTTHQASGVPLTVPYTISNRYYAADVHFAAYPLNTVTLGLFSNGDADQGERKLPPAMIFVWADGEAYAKHVEELSRTMALGGYEPEVCLAVRIPKAATGVDDNADDNADIDSTLMSFGFEYVDARETGREPSRVSSDEHDADIPRLPRVLDALSTIMWPSMRSANAKTKAAQKAASSTSLSPAQIQARKEKQQERDSIMEELLAVSEISGLDGNWKGTILVGEVEEVADSEEEEELGEEVVFSPYDFGRASGSGSGSGSMGFGQGRETKSKTRKEKEASPWLLSGIGAGTGIGPLNLPSEFSASAGSADEGGIVSSPTDIEALSPFGVRGSAEGDVKGKKISIGFEDDFTVFVSAPALPPPSGDAAAHSRQLPLTKDGPPFSLDLSEAGYADHEDRDGDTPMQTSMAERERVGTGDSLRVGGLHAHTYRSLGSVSDFGGSDVDVDERRGYEALGEDADADGWGDKEGEEEEEEWEDAVEEGDTDEIESWGDDDEGLPTKEEIKETAVKIFGGVPTSQSLVGGSRAKMKEKEKEILESGAGAGFARASDVLKEKEVSEMMERMRRLGGMAAAADITAGMAAMEENAKAKAKAATPSSALGTRGPLPEPRASLEEDGDEDDDGGGGGGGAPATFDLERVLHSLQAFRSEISGMEDEDEKRRMAARVALGLVYGLEGMDDDDT
ncbi:hypothetical protein GALMADRAFT_238566 [Galerina marginata CBS 339.88]|uniref:Uncharacterized protein n=1 Tax=Galerina marginata (strain CBS 339.88) TaxID=685588 RepID=A0A067TSP0_GALM3|nr:hypothetical protein GALMADRAFT_238566 [Galerina marginata CBS 339.88]